MNWILVRMMLMNAASTAGLKAADRPANTLSLEVHRITCFYIYLSYYQIYIFAILEK
jgi:hypothetical protein